MSTLRIIVVHDELGFLDDLATILRIQGHEVTAYVDPLLAWDALKSPNEIALLITGGQFSPGKPHEIALARWARHCHPNVRVLFIAQPDMQPHTDGLGVFLSAPSSAPKVAAGVSRLLAGEAA